MLERHDSCLVRETECEEDKREDQENGEDTFSPREHQAGFWS